MLCGKVLFSNNANFTFVCAFCKKNYNEMYNFGEHLLENHLGKNAKDTQIQTPVEPEIVNEKSQADTNFETIFIEDKINEETFYDTDNTENGDNLQDQDNIKSNDEDNRIAEPKIEISNKTTRSCTITKSEMDRVIKELTRTLPVSENDYKPKDLTTSDDEYDEIFEPIIQLPGKRKISAITESEMDQMISELKRTLPANKGFNKPKALSLANDKNNGIFKHIIQLSEESKRFTITKPKVNGVVKILKSALSGNKDDDKSKVPTSNQLECQYCDKKFTDKRLRKRHESRHFNETAFQCSHCGKYLTSKDKLVTHTFCHTGERPFKCNTCSAGFRSNSGLKRHMQQHLSKKQFECRVCNKGFYTKSDLVAHMRTHTGEKPYQCEDCGVNYAWSGQLTEHKKRHANIRDYVCGICKKAFFTKRHLRHHIGTHLKSNAKKYNCTVCTKSFMYAISLISHMKAHDRKAELKPKDDTPQN